MTGEETHGYRIAVWLLIASEALLFAGLFAVYTAYRAEYAVVFAHGVEHDLQWVGGTLTLILIASSFGMAWSVHEARAGRDRAVSWWLAGVMLLGAAFMALKLTEWFVHIHDGIVAGVSYHGPYEGRGTRLFFTLYYLMTGLHMFHLLVGIGLVAWVFSLARRGRASKNVLAVELVGVYWNFVDMIWMFLWPMFYLMRVPS